MPTARVGFQGIAGYGIREALQPTPANFSVAAGFATVADAVSVAQSLKQIAAVIQFGQRRFHQVADTDGHPAARLEIAVGPNGHQGIASRAMIGLPAGHEELKCPVHGDLGSPKPTPLCLLA